MGPFSTEAEEIFGHTPVRRRLEHTVAVETTELVSLQGGKMAIRYGNKRGGLGRR